MENLTDVLKKTILFRGIEEMDIEKLCRCLGCYTAQYGKNEVLWLTGDRRTEGAIVLSGAVRAEMVSAGGERSITAIHREGSLFGDVLMASKKAKSPVDIVAAEPSRVMYVPYDRIMGGCGKCCRAHDLLRENLLEEIAEKFWILNRKVKYLTEKTLRGKIMLYLSDCAKRAGGPTFSTGCTRDELADILGANRSALSRELCRMRDEGIIEFYRDSFKISLN